MVSPLASSSLLACGSKSGNAPAVDSTPVATSPVAADSAHGDGVRHTKAGSVTRLMTRARDTGCLLREEEGHRPDLGPGQGIPLADFITI
jgi:hypothetical protein